MGGRGGLEAPQRLLGEPERALGVIEMPHRGAPPAGALLDAPAAEGGETVEQAIQDQGAEEDLRRVVNGEEVLGADVLAAAQVVGDRHAVVVEGPIEQAPTAAYVQDERDIWRG